MTKRQIKIVTITGAAALLLWWFLRPKAASATPKVPTAVTPTGDVLLGTPTVSGPSATSGGSDYYKAPADNPYCRLDQPYDPYNNPCGYHDPSRAGFIE